MDYGGGGKGLSPKESKADAMTRRGYFYGGGPNYNYADFSRGSALGGDLHEPGIRSL